jgi:hypothetical protein
LKAFDYLEKKERKKEKDRERSKSKGKKKIQNWSFWLIITLKIKQVNLKSLSICKFSLFIISKEITN